MTNQAIIKDDTYLNNLPLVTRLGEDAFQKLGMNQLVHTNPVGMKAASLLLITETFSPEISEIRGSHAIRRGGFSLDDTTPTHHLLPPSDH